MKEVIPDKTSPKTKITIYKGSKSIFILLNEWPKSLFQLKNTKKDRLKGKVFYKLIPFLWIE